MKSLLSLFLAVLIVLSFTACGVGEAESRPGDGEVTNNARTQTTEEGTDRPRNDNMTYDQLEKFTYDMTSYVSRLGDIDAQLGELCKKYEADINAGEHFDWSRYDDFKKIAVIIEQLDGELSQYDDSFVSYYYQKAYEEIAGIVEKHKNYIASISKERSVKELTTLLQQLSCDTEIGFSNSDVYMTMALIDFCEENGIDEETTNSFREQIDESPLYRGSPLYSGKTHSSSVDTTVYYRSVFTNSYGTSMTKCAHQGCTSYIASSGDTNACIVHSNKCLGCGKYIDEDALICMDCLSGKTTQLTSSGKYTDGNKVPEGGCQFQYFDGSKCGEKVEHYINLCDRHFKELNDIYCSLAGK